MPGLPGLLFVVLAAVWQLAAAGSASGAEPAARPSAQTAACVGPPVFVPMPAELTIVTGTGAVGTAALALGNTGGEELTWTATVVTVPSLASEPPALRLEVDDAPPPALPAELADPNGQSAERPAYARRTAVSPYVYAGFERVLVLENGPLNRERQPYAEALARLGIGHILTTSWPAFAEALGGAAAWDLVVVDSYTDLPPPPVLDALAAHVAAGGRLILADWSAAAHADHGLFIAMGVRIGRPLTGPVALQGTGEGWRPAPRVDPVRDAGVVNGQVIARRDGAEALLTGPGDQGPAAVLNAAGTTIFNAFQAVDYGDDRGVVEILAAQIAALAPADPWLTVEPDTGTVPGCGSGDLTLRYDARELCGGTYGALVRFQTNDAERPQLDVPVMLAVSGEPVLEVPQAALKYGDVVLGISAVDTLRVVNAGCDLLIVSAITSDNPRFVPAASALYLGPGEAASLVVTYTPTGQGEDNGLLTLRHNDPNRPALEIELSGTGVPPPVMGVFADDLDVFLSPGETAVRSVRVKNDGGSDLIVRLGVESAQPADAVRQDADFVVAEVPFASANLDSVCANGAATVVPAFAERIYALAAAAVPPARVLLLEGGTSSVGYYHAALGRMGYGHVLVTDPAVLRTRLQEPAPWDLVIVNSYTTLLDDELLGLIADHADRGGALIFADWRMYQYPTHRILDTLGVSFVHTIAIPIDFHAVGLDRGLFTVPNAVGDLHWGLNQEYRDGQLVAVGPGALQLAAFSGYPDNGAIVEGPTRNTLFNGFQAVNYDRDDDGDGVPDMVELLENEIARLLGRFDVAVQPETAVIPPASSLDATVTFDAARACVLDWTGRVTVAGNDPATPQTDLASSLRVRGVPGLAASPDPVSFGAVLLGQTAHAGLVLTNTGCDDLHLDGVASSDPLCTVGSFPSTIPPGFTTAVVLTFAPKASGEWSGTLTITSDAVESPEVVVALVGRGVAPPTISVEPSRFDLRAGVDEVITRTLRVTNSGDVDLDFFVDPDGNAGAVTAAALKAAVPGSRLWTVLVFEGGTEPYTLYADAAESLGIAPIVVTTEDDLNLQLASGTGWDLIIVNNRGHSLAWQTLNALYAGYRQGASMIMADVRIWSHHELYLALGFSTAEMVTSPLSFSANIVDHPIFREPNEVLHWTPTDDGNDWERQLLLTSSDAVHLARFDDYPGRGAVLACPDGRSFVNAFQAIRYLGDDDADGTLDIVELIENEIAAIDRAASWLNCLPRSGRVAPGAYLDVTVAAYAPETCANLAGLLRFTSNDPARPTLGVPISLAVDGPSRIVVSPASIALGSTFSGAESVRELVVTNAGCADLVVSSIVSTNAVVTAEPAAFTVPGGGSRAVAVSSRPTELGPYGGELVIASDDALTPAVRVAYAGLCVDVPTGVVSPDSLGAVLVPGGTATAVLSVANTGAEPLSWSVATRQTAPIDPDTWIAFAPAAGVTAPGNVSQVTVTLTAGQFCGIATAAEIVVRTDDATLPEVDVPVTLEVAEVGVAYARPAAFDLGDCYIGLPVVEVLELINRGCVGVEILDARISTGEIELGAELDYLAPFSRQTAPVTFLAARVGAFEESIVFTTDSPAMPEVVVPVRGVAHLPPAVTVDPRLVTITGITVEPGVPVVRDLRLGNEGPGDLVWRAVIGAQAAPWLQVEPDSGVVAPGAVTNLTLTLPLAAGADLVLADSLVLRCNDPRRPVVAVPVSVRLGEVPAPSRSLAAGWSLAGLPQQPPAGEATVGLTFLRGKAPGVLTVFRDGGESGYVLLGPEDAVTLGQGYWLSARQACVLDMAGTTAPDVVEVPLGPGWTLIGYPLADRRTIADVAVRHDGRLYTHDEAVAADLVAPELLHWDTAAARYGTGALLDPWCGYWAASYADDVVLLFDPVPPGLVYPPAAPLAAAAGWSLRVEADGPEQAVVVGRRPDCRDGFDARGDLPAAPPGPGATRGARLVLDRAAWAVPGFAEFRTDFRGLGDGPCAWDMRLEGDRGEHELSWDASGLPADGDLVIRRLDTGEILVPSLKEAAACRVVLAGGRLDLRIEVRGQAPPEAGLDEGLRLRNLPNPFNPSTSFRFNLPRAGRVEVRIFDARGALVRRIDGGTMAVGPARIQWLGRTGSGAPASSGVYFYGLYLDGGRLGEIRKMTLLK